MAYGACNSCGCAYEECECTTRTCLNEITLRGEVVGTAELRNGKHVVPKLVDGVANVVLEPARVRIYEGRITAYGVPGREWTWRE